MAEIGLTGGIWILYLQHLGLSLTQIGIAEAERHLDALNRTLLDRLQRGGEVFLSNAVIHERYLLRACIVNFHTGQHDVEATAEVVARTGRAVDAELRGSALPA